MKHEPGKKYSLDDFRIIETGSEDRPTRTLTAEEVDKVYPGSVTVVGPDPTGETEAVDWIGEPVDPGTLFVIRGEAQLALDGIKRPKDIPHEKFEKLSLAEQVEHQKKINKHNEVWNGVVTEVIKRQLTSPILTETQIRHLPDPLRAKLFKAFTEEATVQSTTVDTFSDDAKDGEG